MTALVQLLAQQVDTLGYTTYVFKVLDSEDVALLGTRYIMCVRWPNWECRQLKNGESGYLDFKEVRAGIDTWYDGSRQIPYKYTNIIFERFIEIQADEVKENFKM